MLLGKGSSFIVAPRRVYPCLHPNVGVVIIKSSARVESLLYKLSQHGLGEGGGRSKSNPVVQSTDY